MWKHLGLPKYFAGTAKVSVVIKYTAVELERRLSVFKQKEINNQHYNRFLCLLSQQFYVYWSENK